jgi:hypothetical protein
MLRGLVEEIVRRRLWPIAVLAMIVAVGAPLLYLQPATQDAGQPATAAQRTPAVPATGELPARARKLLATNDGPAARRHRPKRKQDPFQAPADVRAPSSAAAQTATTPPVPSATSAADGPSKPVPVVITGPDGKPTQSSADSNATSDGSAAATTTGSRVATIDVRYSKHGTHHVMRTLPPLKPFSAGGTLIAVYVRYSPSRKAALFALSPGTAVTGVACKQADGTCRYVYVPAGKHARLTLITKIGQLIMRRIEVVRITPVSRASNQPDIPADGACLLDKLLKLGPGDPPITFDACG